MSAAIPRPTPAYHFPARPRCTPRRTVNYISTALMLGLIGGLGFGGFLGLIILLLLAIPIGAGDLTGWWQLMVVTGPAGAILLGYVGYRTLRQDGAERDDVIVGTILYLLAGGIIGAPVLFPFTILAVMYGIVIGTIPGIVLWLIYGLALVPFTAYRYSPSMDVAAFRRDARRLAALTTWIAILLLGGLLVVLVAEPTSNREILVLLSLLIALATITAPFAWWHSKFLIDWWLRDIERSGAP